MRRAAETIETPYAEADVRDDEPAFGIERDAVRSAETTRKLDREADLRHAAVDHQRNAPHGIGACHADIDDALVQIEHDAIRARDRIDEARKLPRRRVAVDAACGIVQPGLALIGEVEIAVRREVEIVDALEALRADGLDERRHLPARHVERHDPALVVRDERTAVCVKLEPIWPAVVLAHQRPGTGR